MTDVTNLLEQAIAMFGSEAKLGDAIGSSQNAVWHSKRKGRVTAEMATAIDRATGGAVSRALLRPDLFSPIPSAAEVSRNWLVYSKDDTGSETHISIPASDLRVENGCLIFTDRSGSCVTAYAAGTWGRVLEGAPSAPDYPGSADCVVPDGATTQ